MSIPDTSGSAIPSSPAEPDLGTVRKAVTASALGNATEWFDYGLYAVSIVYITSISSPAATASSSPC